MSVDQPETAREHIRNALMILVEYREVVEAPTPSYREPITSRDLRAVEARLHRALEQIERGNL